MTHSVYTNPDVRFEARMKRHEARVTARLTGAPDFQCCCCGERFSAEAALYQDYECRYCEGRLDELKSA